MTSSLTEEQVFDWANSEPVHSGPSWEKSPLGLFILPEKTLGVQALQWADENLLQSDGPLAGTRWTPTPEQVRLILWWYAIDDEGNFLFRRGVLRRMKGWGKDPFLAVIAAVEMLGPCRFLRWDANGNPIARPENSAWIQIAAVSKDQTRNTMTVFPGLFNNHCIVKYDIQVGKEQVLAGRNRIEAITSNYRSLEGGRPTLVILNESHHWVASNGGHDMGQAINRNLAKREGGTARAMEITNAHIPGENSWAEATYDSMQAIISGRSIATGIFYDSLECHPNIDIYCRDMPNVTPADKEIRADMMRRRITKCLEQTRGDSHWLNIPRILEEILDSQTPMELARRFYFNQVVAAEDAWITKQEFDAAAALPSEDIDLGDTIALGFDGSKTRDSTALVAARMSDGLIKTIKVWERPKPPFDEDWEIPKDQVDDMVENVFSDYNVVAFYADVKEWESFVETWSVRYRHQLKVKASPNSCVAWDMRVRLNQSTLAAEALNDSLVNQTTRYIPNRHFNNHFLNARRRPNKYGISFGKSSKESPNKVDAVAATVLAFMARRDFLAREKPEKKRLGFVW